MDRPAVGQRVRVELNPECRHQRVSTDPSERTHEGHFTEENGVTGRVVAWPTDSPFVPFNGHDVAVLFDHPILIVAWRSSDGVGDVVEVEGMAFYAGELVPLEADRG